MSDPLLTDAEWQALAQGVGDGSVTVDTGFNTDVVVRKHDLAGEDSSLGVNLSSVDMINERFIRLFRLGLLEVLRTSPRINPARARILKFGTYLQDLTPPLSVNVVRARGLRGYSTVVIDPGMVFSSLDGFFGGLGKAAVQLPPGRLFTPTESRIIRLILDVLFRSLTEAWAPLMPIDFEVVSSEINPQFAQIADESDLVVLSRFEVDAGEVHRSFIDVVMPYAALKPVRDVLRSRVQTGDGHDESDHTWRRELTEALGDAAVDLRVQLGQVELRVGELEQLVPGQTLWLRLPDHASIRINGQPSYAGTVGALGAQRAVRIDSIEPGTTGSHT